MARRKVFVATAALLCAALIHSPATAQTDLSRFPLAKAIPADVFLVALHRHNPERQFLADHWARVHRAFIDSGILNDVWELVGDLLSDEQAEQVDQLAERFSGLCHAVDWKEMLGKETVFCQRYVTPVAGSPYEGVLLCRLDTDKTDANYQALKAILDEIVSLVEKHGGKGAVAVTQSKSEDFAKAVFGPAAAPNVGIGVGVWKDVVVIGFGGMGLMDECVGLLSGKSDGKGLIGTDRFKRAFAKLPPAEDSLMFWDMSDMLGKLQGMISMMTGSPAEHGAAKEKHKAQSAKKQHQADDDDADDAKNNDDDSQDADEDDDAGEAAILALIPKVFDEISIFDYLAKVEWTDGHGVHSEHAFALRPDAKSKALYEALTNRQPIKNFERLIPKEAKNFSVSSGIDWLRLYRAVREFVAANVPGGPKKLAKFDRIQKEELELDIEKDVLGVIAGGHVAVDIGDDKVWMLKVTDEEKADQQLSRLFDLVSKKTGKEGGLMITEVEIAGHKGFRQISHPMMMMMGGMTPVCGCAEGHFIIATNSKVVRLCLETAKGDHPNITKNERWRSESVMPKSGAVDSISFEDQSEMAKGIQTAIGGLSMAMGMAGMFGQDMPPEVKTFLTKLPPILAKVGPVAGKLDFFQSTGAYCTYDNGVWHERGVQNYKGPRPPGADDEEKAEAKSQKQAKPAKDAKSKKKPKKEEDEDE